MRIENRKLNVKEINLKNGAVLVSDVHYKKNRDEFLGFLKLLHQNPPTQLFLLGDIFHALLPFRYLYEENKEAIELINSLAQKCEVYYAYGNHDFLIDKFFKNVTFADIFVDKEKSFFLTHGDITDSDFLYSIYLKIIRNKVILNFLNVASLNFLKPWVFNMVLNKKIDCSKIPQFKEKILKKIADINYNNIIEGHYHQNIKFEYNKKYWNLGAFVCDKVYYVYNDFELKEVKYGR